LQITLTVSGVPAGAVSKAEFVARRTARERFTATVAPDRDFDMTPPAIIWSPDQPMIGSTEGVVEQAGHV
jgi:hypothetical protein